MTTAQEKRKFRPWNDKAIVDKEYRIIFTRTIKFRMNGVEKLDSYMYFDDKESVSLFFVTFS